MGIWHGTGVPHCDVHAACYRQQCRYEAHILLVIFQREIVGIGIGNFAPVISLALGYIALVLRISVCPPPLTKHVIFQPTGKRMLLWDLYDPLSFRLMERIEIAVTAVADHAGVIH